MAKRFKVKKVRDKYVVKDTKTGKPVANTKDEEKANKIAADLEISPPKNPPATRVYDMVSCKQVDVDEFLDEGWEPFAVEGGFISLKKKLRGN